MTEAQIAGDLYGLSAHPGDIYHRAAMTVEALVRERDEARAACAMNNDTHSRISADYAQTIRALEARIARLTRERDEALAEVALSEKSYEEAYGEAYDEGLQEGRAGAASAASDLWSMLLRHFHKYSVEPASDDGEGHSAYQMMDALHEHEREVDMAHKAEVERLTRERDEARALLWKWDAVVIHQYTGSREAMSDMARVAQETVASLRVAGLTKLHYPNQEEGEHD